MKGKKHIKTTKPIKTLDDLKKRIIKDINKDKRITEISKKELVRFVSDKNTEHILGILFDVYFSPLGLNFDDDIAPL